MPPRRNGPCPTPKQRFEEYEKALRFVAGGRRDQKRTLDRDFKALWRARDQGQRDRIADLLSSALDADREFQRLNLEAVTAFANATAYVNNVQGQHAISDELEIAAWPRVLGEAAEVLDAFRRSQRRARTAWTALRQEHIAQHPNSQNISIADAAAKRDLAGNGIAATAADIARLEQWIDEPPVPAHPITGVQKICPGWLPKERFEQWRAGAFQGPQGIGAAPLYVPRFVAPATWSFRQLVGAGGQGTAELWLLFDANDVLVHRTVRKAIDYSKTWYDVRSFSDPAGNNNARLPWELESHFHMRRAELPAHQGGIGFSNEHIVALGGATDRRMVDDVKKLYRIYTEWCPYGDLSAIIDHYRATVPRETVPEPFIWAVADALIFAGVAMQTGSEGGAPLAHWQQIDLKPANVFLGGLTSTGKWPFYPTPLLGDWGLAVSPPPSSNPRFYQGAGTHGCMAPEQIAYVDNNSLAPVDVWPLGEKTNVFGVGIVLYCLVTQQHTPRRQAWWLGDGSTDRTYKLSLPGGGPDPAQNFANQYSPELRRLIDECTKYDRGARADFARLRYLFNQAITNWMGGEDPGITKGMYWGTAFAGVQIAEQVLTRNDVYAIGLARANVP
ncbi:hypothetical protein DOTSEDRAFT_22768 [Dothistroma septosporum NZE10]|uniref:non-specific serine/threonine protein kinase n=1 Tax=Dothistroma septosporum (strain NZE10 / CBS 128990) TaxID=675120 RepID=N1PTM9_DOTSN|nr:hypothetical protein DOTSEDRAFT_22768 [Dothistroma septosporum NZE10]